MTNTVTLGSPGDVQFPENAGEKKRRLPRKLWQTAGPLVIFVAMFGLVAALTPTFLGGGGLSVVAISAAPILLVALGQALVLNVGSIDLSNASLTLLAAILLAMTLAPLASAAPLVVVLLVTLFGAVNGLLVAFTQVPSFALTLGTFGIFQASALVVSNATTVYVSENGGPIIGLFENRIAGIPLTFWLGVIVAVILWWMLRFTRLGQGMTAIGVNETGAIFSGMHTRWLKVAAFALSGLLAGLAGITIIAQAGSASPTGLGSDLLLPGIAAAIVGGTSISGGVTNPINVIFGALTVALIPIATAVIGIDAQAQNLVYGVVIIAVVALTMAHSRSDVVK